MRERDDVGTLHWVVDMFFRHLSNHSFLLSFPSLRYFLHGLAVHTLYVTSPGYMLSGVASEYDSVVKSWRTFYRPASSKKVYYSLAIPVTYGRIQDMRLGRLRSERAKIHKRALTHLSRLGRWNSILRSRVGLSPRSTRRRALIESNSSSRKYDDRVKPRLRQHQRKIDGVTFPHELISIRNRLAQNISGQDVKNKIGCNTYVTLWMS